MTTLRELMGLLAQPQTKPSLLGALQDPLFYKDMGNNLAGLLGTPTPTKAESDAVLSMIRLGPSVMQSYPSKERQLMQSHDQKVMGLAQMVAPITYHGSPHKFDAFDSSKIGTGEGAQAYGHGLYLADSPAVANEYRNMAQAMTKSGKQIVPGPFDDSFGAINELNKAGGDFAKARQALLARQAAQKVDLTPELKALDSLKAEGATINKGLLYTVDLPDEAVSKMLDWDKPVSPEIGEAIARAIGEPYIKGSLGQDMYRRAAIRLGGEKQAAAFLKQLGIPGIKYLDGGSRGQGAGTSNYVVFDDKLPKILKRE